MFYARTAPALGSAITRILATLGLSALVGTAVVCANAATAHADGHESQRMTLPTGTLMIQAFAEINLSADLALKPLSLAPDIWYGVSDKLSVAILHSSNGGGGLYGGVGSSLCLTGEDNGCPDLYRNVGLNARYSLLEGELPLAVDGGAFISTFDPFVLALKLGLVGKWQGPVDVIFQPNISIGITERDAGNEEVVTIPVAVMYSLSPPLALGLQTGISFPFSELGDNWVVPLSLGARFLASEAVWADVVFSFPSIAAGNDDIAGVDNRSLTVGVGVVL